MASRKKTKDIDDRKGSLGFEEKLWAAADLLRNNVDPAEYKHVVLGLLFLKYISEAFSERQGACSPSSSPANSAFATPSASSRPRDDSQ